MTCEITGAIELTVDATDIDHALFGAVQRFTVSGSGTLVLTLAKWLPAYHAPRGAIDFLAGIEFRAGDLRCVWSRDPSDPYRIAVSVPVGATTLEARFQGLTPTDPWQGRIVITDDILRLDWSAVCLYPAAGGADTIMVEPTLVVPAGWGWACALPVTAQQADRIAFAATDLRELLDCPVMAGRNIHVEALDPCISLTIAADRPDQLPQNSQVLDKHRRLIAEADALFGRRPFARYHFLMSLSDQAGGMGLEHRSSSECGVRSNYFSQWDLSTTEHDLLPHEYVHAWVGKYRVPQGNLRPDYSEMTDELMWVYEGLTQFYGHILAARSGLISAAHTRQAIALIFTTYDCRPGRNWRPLADTDMDPIFGARHPQPWISWQRSEDYYSEGLLLWLEADMLIRSGSRGAASLDDFCQAFFAPPIDSGALGQAQSYDRDDIVAGLGQVFAYDWDAFITARVERIAPHAPCQGITLGGYEIAWQRSPSDWLAHDQIHYNYFDFMYSLGMKVGLGAKIIEVLWDGPAFRAGLVAGTEIVAVGGRAYSVAAVQNAIDQAQVDGQPIALTVRRFDRVKDVLIEWTGGQRYPDLVALAPGPTLLDALLAPRADATGRGKLTPREDG